MDVKIQRPKFKEIPKSKPQDRDRDGAVSVAAGVPPAVDCGILPPVPVAVVQPDFQRFQPARAGVGFSAGRDARLYGRQDARRHATVAGTRRRAPAAGRGLQPASTWKSRLTHDTISLAGIRTLKRREWRAPGLNLHL